MVVRMLLRSWASPPANWPKTARRFSCSSRLATCFSTVTSRMIRTQPLDDPTPTTVRARASNTRSSPSVTTTSWGAPSAPGTRSSRSSGRATQARISSRPGSRTARYCRPSELTSSTRRSPSRSTMPSGNCSTRDASRRCSVSRRSCSWPSWSATANWSPTSRVISRCSSVNASVRVLARVNAPMSWSSAYSGAVTADWTPGSSIATREGVVVSNAPRLRCETTLPGTKAPRRSSPCRRILVPAGRREPVCVSTASISMLSGIPVKDHDACQLAADKLANVRQRGRRDLLG